MGTPTMGTDPPSAKSVISGIFLLSRCGGKFCCKQQAVHQGRFVGYFVFLSAEVRMEHSEKNYESSTTNWLLLGLKIMPKIFMTYSP
jgi:hypothetical protein